jgi:hypothetical protein
MSFAYALALPREQLSETGQIIGPATGPSNWLPWPIAMVPIALLGVILAARVWHARPQAVSKKAAH